MTSDPVLPPLGSVVKSSRVFLVDLTERVVATFVVAVGGVFVAAGPADVLSVSFWEGAAIAGFAAVGSLLKGMAARAIGDRNSASAAPRV